MHNLRTVSDLTVDKPGNDLSRAWKDLSRAWNDLPRAWNGLSRAKTGVPEFSFFVPATAKFGIPPPKKVQQSGYSWWHKNSKTYSFEAIYYILGPCSSLLLCIEVLGSDLYPLELLTFRVYGIIYIYICSHIYIYMCIYIYIYTYT